MKKGVIITGSIIAVVIIGLVCFGESFRPGVTVKNITRFGNVITTTFKSTRNLLTSPQKCGRFGNVITTTFKSTVMQGSFLIILIVKKLLLTERNIN